MKALSLHQPWASAIALGSKRIETRHWTTRHRGPLAIHAAKRRRVSELLEYGATEIWIAALYGALDTRALEHLPFGAIVATCVLVDCIPVETFDAGALDRRRCAGPGCWTERDMGNFSAGRFGWVLDNIKPLRLPVPFHGLQGIFNVSDELLEP